VSVSVPAAKPQARIVQRAGFGQVGAKLGRERLTVAYFGASVTAQREGYRPLLHRRLCDRFGQDHQPIFAAVGGIDVAAAVFLTDDLVIRHRPDLCLVEFTSVEPGSAGLLARAETAMDGVIVKLREIGCMPCLLHLPRREVREGSSELRDAFERVADRHRIPSIDVTSVVEGSSDPATAPIFRDEVHTSDSGSCLVAELVERAIGSLAGDATATVQAGVPDPVGDDYRHAHVIPVAEGDADGPAELRLFRLQRQFLELGAGTAIRRRFSERLAGLVMLVGPESGELEISDGRGPQRLMAWDQFCSYERFTASVFDRPCNAGDEVSIELTGTVPDYSRSRHPIDPPERRLAKVMGYMVLPT
jgi:hypothetical protein